MEKGVTMEDDSNLKELLQQKEKDWMIVLSKRLKELENDNGVKQHQITETETKFEKLKQDFKYNLKLLQERDAELNKYENLLSTLKAEVNLKYTEVSDLQIVLDEKKSKIMVLEQREKELHQKYKKKLLEKELHYHSLQSKRDEEIRTERNYFEGLKLDLDQQVTQLRSELDVQKRELMQEFDEMVIKKDKEHKQEVDQLSLQSLESQLKSEVLTKEIEILKSSIEEHQQSLALSSAQCLDLERSSKKLQWKFNDEKSTLEYRIIQLTEEVTSLKEDKEKLLKKLHTKQVELETIQNQASRNIQELKDTNTKRIEDLQSHLAESRTKVDESASAIRQLELTNEQLTKEKTIITERYQTQIQDMKTEWMNEMTTLTKATTNTDTEMNILRQSVSKLNDELVLRKADIARYKTELAAALERQRSISLEHERCEMEWKKKYDDAARIEFSKNEELLESVSRARDDALRTVEQKDNQLQDRDKLIQAIRAETSSSHVDFIMATRSEMDQLQTQNDGLRQIISEMRTQMEQLSTDSNSRKEQAQDINPFPTQSAAVYSDVLPHVKSLNQTIGSLRVEKQELLAQLKKQQVRIGYLQSQLQEATRKPEEKQVEIDQLRYELASTERRLTAERDTLQMRVSEVETREHEVRKEAQQFHRANLESVRLITDLQNQLSLLKLSSECSPNDVKFGAKDLLIQQLQDELGALHTRRDKIQPMGDESGEGKLEEKLRYAAKQLVQLTRENQQLTQLGNQLRAEILQRKATVDENNATPVNRLKVMEDLQYNLTKQELQYAKQSPEHGAYKTKLGPSQDGQSVSKPNVISSVDTAELQEVWQLLDNSFPSEISSRIINAGDKSPVLTDRVKPDITNSSKRLIVSGQSTRLQRPEKIVKPQTRGKTKTEIKTKPKVRNYNLIKDSVVK